VFQDGNVSVVDTNLGIVIRELSLQNNGSIPISSIALPPNRLLFLSEGPLFVTVDARVPPEFQGSYIAN